MADDEPIVREIYIDASPEETFPYLTESDKYRLWMGLSAELDARPGGIFRVDPNGRDVISGEFVAVEPPHRIVFTWGWDEPGRPVPAGFNHRRDRADPQSGTAQALLSTVASPASVHREKGMAAGWPHYLAPEDRGGGRRAGTRSACRPDPQARVVRYFPSQSWRVRSHAADRAVVPRRLAEVCRRVGMGVDDRSRGRRQVARPGLHGHW